MRKSPLFSAMAVFCLAAGIGLSTFMFSITYAIVGRGLPFAQPDRIVSIMQTDAMHGAENRGPILVDDFRDIREQQTQFAHLAAVAGDTVTVGLPGNPRIVSGLYASPELFQIMPGKTQLGRVFTATDAEAGAPPVLILSHRAWITDFGRDPDIVGQECIAEGRPYTIIGVMEPNYDYPTGSTQVWMPLVAESLVAQTGWIDRVLLLGRLADGATIETATAEMSVVFQRIAEARGEDEPARFQPSIRLVLDMFLNREIRVMMWAMFGATLLVLFIACTNVSSLLSARLAARENEMAIRSALGASRRRLIFQLLAESLLAAVVGMLLGLFVAWNALELLWAQLASFRFNPPAFMEFRLDGPTMLMAIALMVLAVVLAALLPALRASRTNLSALLNDSGRTASNLRMSRLGSFSTILQLAFSLALLVAAGRLIYGLIAFSSAELPVSAEGLLVGSIAVDSSSYPTDQAQVRFWDELHRELEGIPGAASVALGFNVPGIPGMRDAIQIEGTDYASEDDYPSVRFDVVSPGYFATVGVPITQGRDFAASDVKGKASVAIINQVMAARFWPGENPVGRWFLTSDVGGLSEEERRHRVIGIVPDLAMHGLFNDEEDGAGFYRAQGQSLWGDQKIFVRTAGSPAAMIPAVQRTINTLDPNLAFSDAQAYEDHLKDSTFYFRFFLNLFSVFGVMALLLAATGVYGIIQYVVNNRTAEISIRMALGATAGNIRWLILRKGLRNASIGIVLGTVLAFGLSTVLDSAFPFLETEYVSYGVSVLILLGVALVANLVPAIRAARLDPMNSLRER